MKSTRKGFTLIELMVVVIILGILASMSMPYYSKTVETSKATDALAIGHLLASSYRMLQIDYPNYVLNGSISNTCNSGSCSTGDNSACRLVRCNYVAKQDWTNASYSFSFSGAGVRVDRIDSGSQFDAWGYDFNMIGGCSPSGGAPSCPTF